MLLRLAALLVAAAAAAHGAEVELLTVVGRVTATDARVLVDAKVRTMTGRRMNDPIRAAVALVKLYEALDTPDRRPAPIEAAAEVTIGFPTVVKVAGLRAGVVYAGSVSAIGLDSVGDARAFEFRTMPSDRPPRLAVVSCNRYNEDRDARGFIDVAGAGPDVVYHIGDQVYTDRIERQCRATRDHCADYAKAYSLYRSFYWDAWTEANASAVLRGRSNVMVGDDHDVLSNLQALAYQDQKYKPFVAVGLLAHHLFQVQLTVDIPEAQLQEVHACLTGADPDRCSFSLAFGVLRSAPSYQRIQYGYIGDRPGAKTLDVVLLDTRFDRLLSYDRLHPLASDHLHSPVGMRQWLWLQRTLDGMAASWDAAAAGGGAPRHDVVVLSQVPLLFHAPFAARVAHGFEGEVYTSHPERAGQTGRVLETLWGFHARQRRHFRTSQTLLVGGDLHQYAEGEICPPNATVGCLNQVVTSGMTARSTSARSVHLMAFNLLTTLLGGSLPEGASPSHLVYTPNASAADFGRNALVVEAGRGALAASPLLLDGCAGDACWWDVNAWEKWLFVNFAAVGYSVLLGGWLLLVTVPKHRRMRRAFKQKQQAAGAPAAPAADKEGSPSTKDRRVPAKRKKARNVD
eukprot:TRINITY_DN2376_c0_g2_i1.p2 TRINITY_DN2376_c0_g2~~TRINITY_DN2376_c0_g2_i1.p2  ORF type:complete len:628 (+),score=196.12 TRINITY_DN2376_c0_g2_i1:59-1942(+)